MDRIRTFHIRSESSDATERIGETLGAKLRGGEVIELISDLGGGKTTFVRGLARGMGSMDRVASPTFTLSREYTAGTRVLYHFDLYRLQSAGTMPEELAEVVNMPHAVVVVEWGDIVRHVLPVDAVKIAIQATGDTERELVWTYTDRMAYLVPGESES
jgi:tRNA threonylcarbamoyladenosine biosynthesis protein TsaE